MPLTKREALVQGINEVVARSEALAEALSDEQWARPAYEQGWNARQILAHIGAMGSISPALIGLAKNPPPPPAGSRSRGGSGGGPDPDAWNAQQVGARDGKTVAELLAEVRAGHQSGLQALEGVSDTQLDATATLLGHTDAAGTLLRYFLVDHSMAHLQDLAEAAGF